MFFSLLEEITGRGELTECSKLTCFTKRMLDMVLGGSGKVDRRLVPAAVEQHWRACAVESELGKGKNRPNTTTPNSTEGEKATRHTNTNSRTWHKGNPRYRREIRHLFVHDPDGKRNTLELLNGCL